MKKVLFLIGTLSTGGAERVVSNLSLNLSSDINKKIFLYQEKVVYPYDGELKVLEKPSYKTPINKVGNILFRYKQIKEIKNRNVGATLISFLEFPNLINLMTKKYGTTIISVRNHMSSKYKTGLSSFFWRWVIRLYGRADKIIVVSEEIKKDLIKNFGISKDKIKVIHNSYNLNEIKKLSEEKVEEKYRDIFNSPVIITAGRLNNQKGQWHLIKAFKKVKDKMPDIKLVILGDGELKGDLKKLSNELGLLKDIHFLGFKSNPFKYIAKSKVFILTSLYEGFPNALAEAMACGVPVVSTDCLSGPREILAPNEINVKQLNYELRMNRYGLLVPVCDGKRYEPNDELSTEEDIIAKYLLLLLEDKDLWNHFARKSLERIKDFDIKEVIKEWESLI